MNAFGRLHRDERGVILSFVLKAIIVFVILGFVIEEAGQLIRAQIHAEDAARAAALSAANAYFNSTNENYRAAEQAAQATVQSLHVDARVISVKIVQNGRAAIVVTEVPAKTLIISHIGFLKHYGVQHASDEEAANSG